MEIELEEDCLSFSTEGTSPIKQEQAVTIPSSTQQPTRTSSTQLEMARSSSEQFEVAGLRSGLEPGHSWQEHTRISSSHIKPERFPVKSAESLHPAFHKHLLSQVRQDDRSSSETLERSRIVSCDSRLGVESYYDPHAQLRDHEISENKKARDEYDSRAGNSSSDGIGLDFAIKSRERNFSEGSQSLLSSNQEKLPSQSSFEEGEIDINTHIVEYPSQFPGLKDRISIKNETVLVTKLNGVNIKTGGRVSLYKCYMCNKMYNKMSKLQCHMSMHFERNLSVYTCELCGATFKFRLQLVRHISRVHHSKPYAPPLSHRWHSQSSVPPAGGLTVTSPDDYKTRSPLVTSRESPTEGGSATQHDRKLDDASHVTGDRSSHLARSCDQASSINQDPEQEGSQSQSGDQEPPEQEVRYHGYPLGSIGSSLASSHPALHKYLYRRYSGTYVCQYCNKSFFRLFSLQRHEQVHTGIKSCFCKECGKGFSEPRNLRQHIIRYHGEHGSIGDDDVHSIRRLRRPISSGLPRTSQRLAPVTPDMIQEAERLEKEAAMQKVGIHPTMTASPPSAYDFVKLPSSFGQRALERPRTYSGGSESMDPQIAGPHLTSPSAISATTQLKVETSCPVRSHPTTAFSQAAPNPAHLPVPPPQPSPSGHLASQIRQKEKLSEDVVVIIPSDAPLEGTEANVVTPRSVVSDTASWPEHGGSDSDSNQSMEVIHSAPRRSIMMDYRNTQVKAKERRKSQPVRIPSPSDDQEVAHLPPQEQLPPPTGDRASVIREKLPSPIGPPPGPKSAPPVDANSPPPVACTSLLSMSSPTVASMASAGMLFPGAHDLSSTTSPLAGLHPGAPPMYLGSMLHPGLLSPSTLPLLRGAGPSLLHPGAPPALDPATALRLGIPSPTAWAAMADSFSPSGSGGGATGGGDPRMPTPSYARSSGSAGRNSR